MQGLKIKKLKVMTVVGTRPELIRLSRVIFRLNDYCDHVLVHTGQNYDYELNKIFFEDLDIREPDYYLNAAGDSGTETIANVISATDKILESETPDAVLVLGDTNSCMAVLPAKKRKIPVFHMEAGNRCFDQRVPEEINRRIVDHIADINLTYSSIAREYLIHEGLPADMVIKTGSPMKEVISCYLDGINKSDILARLGLKENSYFVVSSHREENIDSDKNFNKLVVILNALADAYDFPVIVSAHPRTRNKIDEQGVELNNKVRMCSPMGFMDYIKLQINSKAVLSDSGTISEESSILNFPALNLREAHERPEAMEEASVMMVGLEVERVIQALHILEEQDRGDNRLMQEVGDYSIQNVSEKVVRIIHSYTDYVNRVVWKKY